MYRRHSIGVACWSYLFLCNHLIPILTILAGCYSLSRRSFVDKSTVLMNSENRSYCGGASQRGSFHVRPLTLSFTDQELLWKFLMYAAQETNDVRDMEILQPYAQDWGQRPGDVGMLLVMDDSSATAAAADNTSNVVVGAAWIRDLKGHGLCRQDSENFPELAMAILPSYRGQGLGTILLEAFLQHAATTVQAKNNMTGICLSCRTDNTAAMRLYQKLGFIAVANSEHENRAGGTSIDMIYKYPCDSSTTKTTSAIQNDGHAGDFFVIRPATANDTKVILELIHETAAFDHKILHGPCSDDNNSMQFPLAVTEQRLLETLFCKKPYAYVFLAEKKKTSNSQDAIKNVLGFCSIHFRYSTFAGQPSVWLDDLFVRDEFRSHGVGAALMAHLVNYIVQEHNKTCTHIGWNVALANTRGLAFYHRLQGAEIVEQHGQRAVWKCIPPLFLEENLPNVS